MGNTKINRNYKKAYIYSEVSLNGEKYLIPFDGEIIPMEYEELKEISENLKAFLSKVKKEEYESFYNQRINDVRKIEIENYENLRQKIYKEKKEKEKEYIVNFDYHISKPILEEKEIEKIIKKMPMYSSEIIDMKDIKYPVILNFYKDKILLKSMTCFKNLVQTLNNIGKTLEYDSYSYSHVPEEYIGQILEYIILFKNPIHNSSFSLRNYVVYCPINILVKRLNKDKDYMFRKDNLLKLLEKNKVYYFERDGRIIVNARLALKKVGDFLSGMK